MSTRMVYAMAAGFTERLRTLMAERCVSGYELARRVPCNRSYISLLAQGKRQPSPKVARRLDEILGAGGELAALTHPDAVWHPPGLNREFSPDDEERLTLAVQRPSRTDARVVDSLAVILAGQRQLEDRIGSEPMLA